MSLTAWPWVCIQLLYISCMAHKKQNFKVQIYAKEAVLKLVHPPSFWLIYRQHINPLRKSLGQLLVTNIAINFAQGHQQQFCEVIQMHSFFFIF